ncbi:hypothetical protein GWI33_004455 [Rhynchophorus ferrugineus]|uniref:Uncharacterized protein n=1 Tax=Rhynchophorus ferrugineus TaxID=354439 RepID=A0A834MIQ5_RHYFE|nr:hypothetical protein GWI33_004455 [Rhynchophorus ferrugineus]
MRREKKLVISLMVTMSAEKSPLLRTKCLVADRSAHRIWKKCAEVSGLAPSVSADYIGRWLKSVTLNSNWLVPDLPHANILA